MCLKEKVKLLPQTPGVYLMKDKDDNIIYIGKAKSLKNRVGQYFQKSKQHPPKIIRMVDAINSIEIRETDTELEALLLECELIKKIKPEYNRLMKNEGRYIFIQITSNERFPKIQIVKENDTDICYGPYTSLRSVERAVTIIRESFKLRHCNSFPQNTSGCLNLQLGFCSGPCCGEIEKEQYLKQIERVRDFLSGKDISIIKQVEAKMEDAAEKLDFDKAAKYRDDLFALQHLLNKQKTISFTKNNRNIIAIEYIDDSTAKMLFLKGSKVLYSTRIGINNEAAVSLKEEIKQLILSYFAKSIPNKSPSVDKQMIDQSQILYSYLKNKKDCVHATIPETCLSPRNEKRLEEVVNKLLVKLIKV